jgi:hypothetical protein
MSNDNTDFSSPSMTELLLEQIPFMPKQERARLRKELSHLPPYVFMTQKEKIAHFKGKSEEFNRKIREMPQKVSKTKKVVKFQNFFDYRTFRENDAADKVSTTLSVRDRYQP